jgi:hypothetical protein
VVPLWVCDALGEEAEYDGEEEGEAAADVGMEAATEEERSDDVSDAEDAFAAGRNGFNKDKNTSRRKEPTIKFENRRLGGRAKIIRHPKNEARG